jgi:hypothetical protein
VHKGIERRFEGMTLAEGIGWRRVSGDSTVAFAWAYAMAMTLTETRCRARIDASPLLGASAWPATLATSGDQQRCRTFGPSSRA